MITWLKSLRWMLSGPMIAAAIAGWFMFVGLRDLRTAAFHDGPGYVWYDEPERRERVPEEEHRRDRLASGVMMLGFGVFVWVLGAQHLRDERTRQGRG